MDDMTTMMCNQGAERIGFAKLRVEINAAKECKDSIEKKIVELQYRPKVNVNKDILKENNSEAYMRNRNEKNVNKVPKEDVNKGQKADGKKLETIKSRVRKNANGKWFVNQNVIDYVKVSANKYVVLQEDYDEEFSPYISPIKQNELDTYLKYKRKPTKEDSKEWNESMKLYFDYKWRVIEKYDEEIQEDVFDDYYKIGEFLKVNELRNEGKNVLAEGGVDGLKREVRKLIQNEKLNVCTLIETHLQDKKISDVCVRVFGDWNWISNSKYYDNGCRILVGWDQIRIRGMEVQSSKQAMLCVIKDVDQNFRLFYTFIYASNNGRERKELRKNLVVHKCITNGKPWGITRDFNVTLKIDEHSDVMSHSTIDVQEFQKCVEEIEMEDLNGSGFQFT
ncbi:RNA-directed DNA polymerase, eukaryota, reverse transcriptase zinc-binding domain protein [Tanacetum coccineum]